MKRKKPYIAILLLAGVLTSCKVGKSYVRPVVYDAFPREVNGTIAPLEAFTKNKLILSLCSR